MTVGSIVERVVARRLDAARLGKLKRIGIDEFSYRKRHRYLTVVVDHDQRRVVLGRKGAQRGDVGGLLRAVGTWRVYTDRVGDGGPGVELAEGVGDVGSARAGGVRPFSRLTAGVGCG